MLPGCEDKLEYSAQLARTCAFTLDLVAPQLPKFPTPEGHNEMSHLRAITLASAHVRYASRPRAIREQALAQIEYELRVIEELDFPGYFLIVHDLVEFCRQHTILCQGRGSAANSAVCFALGITNVEPVAAGLLFERFLSPRRCACVGLRPGGRRLVVEGDHRAADSGGATCSTASGAAAPPWYSLRWNGDL